MVRQRWAWAGLGVLVLAWVALGVLLLTRGGRDHEAAVVKEIERMGGRVRVDDKRPGKPVVAVDLSRTHVWVAGLKELKEVRDLQKMNLDGTHVSAVENLRELKKFKNLQELNLSGTQVTDAGLKELKELKALHVLYLGGTDVTDAGLKEFKDLQALHTLALTNTKVTDAGVKELKAARPDLQIYR